MLLLLAVVLLLSNSLFVVKETERAVLLRFGEVVDPDVTPGLHFKLPIVYSVRRFDGRVLTVAVQPHQKALVLDRLSRAGVELDDFDVERLIWTH